GQFYPTDLRHRAQEARARDAAVRTYSARFARPCPAAQAVPDHQWAPTRAHPAGPERGARGHHRLCRLSPWAPLRWERGARCPYPWCRKEDKRHHLVWRVSRAFSYFISAIVQERILA